MDLMTGMIDMMIGFGCILATIVYRDTHGPFFFLGSDSEKASGMIWSKLHLIVFAAQHVTPCCKSTLLEKTQ